jgi:hypothetical protein
MPERPEDAELSALEHALLTLAPRAEGLDRAALLFRAGQASRRPGWAWPAATLVSATVAAVLGVLLWLRPAPAVVERVVYVEVSRAAAGIAPARPVVQPAPTPPKPETREQPSELIPPSAPEESVVPSGQPRYLQIQEHVLRWGLDALAAPTAPPGPPPPTVEDLLRSL